jgi:hypothetical protein
VLAYILIAVIGIAFVLWPEFGSHMWVWGRPRPVFVRLVGAALLLMLAWLIFLQASQ